ncbi:ferredoxin, partial [Patescibacteria group bacterium]
EALCPDVFKMENGKSEVLKDECGEGCNCQEAVNGCPVAAISIEE